jgi:lipopolysaccharide/colanic/teichoic acid biosynthesis glycosyltransferase
MVTNPEKDIQLTAVRDTRTTKLGKFLRRVKIDELPQLFNVLKGDMSFVGYRPELPFYVERYTKSQMQLLSYKPGITDPATLYFRNESELLDQDDIIGSYTQQILPIKLKLSLTYARKANFCSDLICLFKTFFYTPTQKNKRIKATS